VKGFREVYKGSTQTILLSDYAEVDLVRLVKEERPRLVLAVGDPALEKSRKVRQVPVVAVMALSFNLQKPPASNIHGVSVAAPPAKYLELLSNMRAKRVGVLYDPARSGFYMKRAREAADRAGLKLVSREVRTPREVLEKLDQFKGAVDAVWMLPDTTAVTGGTVEAYFTFSMKQQLPVVSFSERHLSRGAVASIDIDRVDMGRQAGELVISLLRDGAGFAGSSIDPRKLQINTNDSVLKKLDLTSAER
jgi:putative ABC transport system substrate-binding protein